MESSSSDDDFAVEPRLDFLDDDSISKEVLDDAVPSTAATSAQFQWVLSWLKQNKLFKSFDTLLEEYETVLDRQIADEINQIGIISETPLEHISTLDCAFDSIHSSSILSVAFHPEKPWIITSDTAKNLFITNFEDGSTISNDRGNNPFLGSIIALDNHPLHPNVLLVGSMDSKHAVLEIVENGSLAAVRCLQSFDLHRKHVVRVKWAPDGATFLTVSHDKSIGVYAFDTSSLKTTFTKQIHLLQTPEAVEWLLDSKKFVVSLRESSFLLYVDTTSGNQTQISLNALGDDHVSFTVLELKLNNDGSALLALTDKNRAILMRTGHPIQLRNFYGFSSDVLAQPRAIFDKHGMIYITSQDNAVYVFDPRTEHCVAKLEGHSALVRGMAYLPSRGFLATCSYDKIIRLWK